MNKNFTFVIASLPKVNVAILSNNQKPITKNKNRKGDEKNERRN